MVGPGSAKTVGEVEPHRLAEIMRVFANPVRIEILRQLRSPRTLAEIRVHPHRQGGGRSDRTVNVATVRHHLKKLIAIGAVQSRRVLRDGEYLDHYCVNHRQLFALTEELRSMGRIRPQGLGVLDGTVPADAKAPQDARPGPRLIIVNGTYEGKVYRLGDAPQHVPSWTIGRHPESGVCLDYDPYVSLAQAEIRRHGAEFHVHDLPSARNRTQVNWEPLPAGGSRSLAPGDVLGVGRSLLLFLHR
ncbi:MAG TPA: FHA domain-containing protein [Candidatus Thermoplasmatota archaeon]|nr:FHA domain-containing protein [Candidatus Thermoplasmatota archaeon]